MGKTWKAVEDEVGSMIGVRRNILSGRNNLTDSGARRLGDVLYQRKFIVEIKLRKTVPSIRRALEDTKPLADENNKRWVHFERMGKTKEVLALVCDKDLMTVAFRAILKHLDMKFYLKQKKKNWKVRR